MNGRLILVKHSPPEIKEDLPAREWRLSEEGRLRARRLAEKLSSYPIDFLFSSNEQKARETAQMIAEKCGLELQVGLALHDWLRLYNEQWLVERHGFRSPIQVRRDFLATSVAA